MAKNKDILDRVKVETILSPTPRKLVWDGAEYAIHPLPDSALMLIADTLGKASGLFDGIAQKLFAGREDASRELSVADLLPLIPALPQILATLIPCQSKLIAASLRIDEDVIAETMPLRVKLAALKLVIEAEEMPALIEHFASLIGAFRRSGETPAEG